MATDKHGHIMRVDGSELTAIVTFGEGRVRLRFERDGAEVSAARFDWDGYTLTVELWTDDDVAEGPEAEPSREATLYSLPA